LQTILLIKLPLIILRLIIQ